MVEPYYGDQKTRAELRRSFQDRQDEFHVIVTTYYQSLGWAHNSYKLATGAKDDRMFLKSFNFDVYLSLVF